MDGSIKQSLEERIALLEHRLTLLESNKQKKGISPLEDVLISVGVAYLAQHTSERLLSNPSSDSCDKFLSNFFDCEFNVSTRVDCAKRLSDLSLSLLDRAVEEYDSKKKE